MKRGLTGGYVLVSTVGDEPVQAFVPPPPNQVPDAMTCLEFFLHDRPKRTAVLIKAALAHVQLETIHPFLDGNDREAKKQGLQLPQLP